MCCLLVKVVWCAIAGSQSAENKANVQQQRNPWDYDMGTACFHLLGCPMAHWLGDYEMLMKCCRVGGDCGLELCCWGGVLRDMG